MGTLVVISLDSIRTGQRASEDEIAPLRSFLDVPGNLLVVAPHHNSGDDPEAEFFHHGDRLIPPEQRFSGFARSILAGLDVPVRTASGSARRFCLTEIPPGSNASPTSTDWACSKASRRSTHTRTAALRAPRSSDRKARRSGSPARQSGCSSPPVHGQRKGHVRLAAPIPTRSVPGRSSGGRRDAFTPRGAGLRA